MDVARNLQVKDLSRKETDEEEYRKGVDSKQDIMNTFVDEARSVSTTLDGHPDCSGDVKIVKQDYN